MNVIGFSGLANSISFKRREFAGLTERELNIAQGLDAAACLAADGGIVAAAAEERFTRQKATGAFPLNALRFCLAAGNLNPEDVDIVAHGFDYEPHRGQFQRDDFSRRQFNEVFSAEAQRRLLREHFEAGRWGEKLVRVPHHLAHAASAFYLSGFERSLVLVSDGMGEVESLTVAVGEGKDLKILTTIPAFHSLGALYGVFTLYLGFYMNSDEYKVMGLAPYGSPRRFFDSLMGCVSLKPDGTYTIPIFSHNQTLEEQETHRGVLRFLADRFGPAREPESEITQTHKDLAAALQAVTQACQIHVLRHFKRETGQKNLCLAGGVALNCSANGVIKRSELFDRVFVQPAAGDDGCAMGAALYAQRLHSSRFQPRRMTTPLWGPQFSRAEILEALDTRGDCEFRELSSFGEVCSETARRLQGGEIVAWFQGRMEFGPRALGSRSILADPRDATMRDRINALVKKREGFRPFAPVVTREAAASIFDIPPGQEAEYAHMLFVTHVKPEFRAKLPATTHVDGSARVQTVSREENERLWDLLNQFGAETGMPVLLNTSFNVRGQPIVCNPSEAIETFIRAGLDVLVIGDFVVTRGNKAVKGDESETEAAAERGRLRECAERYEEFWVNRLLSMEPASLPLKRNERAESNQSKRRRTPFLLEEAAGTHGWRSEELFAGFLLWLSRVSGMENFDLAYSSSRMQRAVAADGELSRSVPFHVGFDLRQGLEPAFASVRAELAKISERGTWFRDAGSRHPELKAIGEGELKLPVGVFVSDARADGAPGLETEITFILA
ncbi:MAG TPA: carbamoyltransferase C-terminal domain-containing protein, partial [Verrucomicrobiae bacterium]|nr:carbamoyltransferase C-terminal domain-containing protein [Verrucomicrobiae bacterium]